MANIVFFRDLKVSNLLMTDKGCVKIGKANIYFILSFAGKHEQHVKINRYFLFYNFHYFWYGVKGYWFLCCFFFVLLCCAVLGVGDFPG